MRWRAISGRPCEAADWGAAAAGTAAHIRSDGALLMETLGSLADGGEGGEGVGVAPLLAQYLARVGAGAPPQEATDAADGTATLAAP